MFYQKIRGDHVLPESWDYKPPAGIEVIGARNFEELAKHSEAWDDLFLKSNLSFFSSYPWINAYITHLIEDHESWICLFAYLDGELIGVLPLVIRRSYRMLGRSIILFRTPFSPMHTSTIDCLMPPDNHIALEIFYDFLSKIPSTWPIISFKELLENSPALTFLNKHKGYSIVISGARQNYIQLSGTYEEYQAGISSNLRRLIKRNTKKLKELDKVKFVMRESQRSTNENMNRFMDAEHSGWKKEVRGSVKSYPKHAATLSMAAEDLAKRGWMEWNFIEIDNCTTAAHYAIRVNRIVYVMKIAFVDEYNFCSPGNLLFNKMIENSFLQGDVDEIHTLADCPWHYQWQVKSRRLYDALLLPRIPVVSHIIKLVFRVMRKKTNRNPYATNKEEATRQK